MARSRPVSLRTKVVQAGHGTAVRVPDDVFELLGAGKRPLVVLGVHQHTVRSAVASMGGAFMIALSAENRVDAMEAAAPSRKKEDVRQAEVAKTRAARERSTARIVATPKGT